MRNLLTSLFLALGLVASAQTVTLDITWRDTTVIGADMTYAQAKSRWPAWVGYMEHIGASSRVLNIRKFCASWNNAVWANDNGPGVTDYRDGCGSRANLRVPYGVYRVDIELIQPQGVVWGEGSQGYLLDSWVVKSGGTMLVYDHAGWDGVGNHAGYGGDPSKRYLIKDQTWGRTDNFGYTEGAQLHGFKIEGQGNGFNNPSYHFSAIGAWMRGEVSTVDQVFIYNANNHGIELGGQFHATFHSNLVSVFKCGVGAYGIYGGGHLQVHMGSFDDNPSIFHVRKDAKGSIGNGTAIKAYGMKTETGQAPGPRFSRGQLWCDAEGWVMLDVYGGYYSRVNTKPHELFRIKSIASDPTPQQPNPQPQESRVSLHGVTWFNTPAYILHDRVKNELIPMDQGISYNGVNSRIVDFTWTSERGVIESSGVTLLPVPAQCDERLAPAPIIGYDANNNPIFKPWVGCSPLYSYQNPIQEEGGPVPPPPTTTPCTYTYSNWSTCTNGRQTRTVVSATPAGCTGTPGPLEQACTVAPTVVRWASTFSGTNGCTLVATTGTNSTQSTSWACGTVRSGALTTNRCTSFPLAMPATRVVYMGVTFTSWDDWGWLNSAIRTRADGTLIDGSGKTLATVTRGTKIDRLVLDLLPGTTLQSVIGPADRNVCGTAVMTVESVEVY